MIDIREASLTNPDPRPRPRNEYQDQSVWFEVQGKYNGRWEMLTTDDTREGANETKSEYEENAPETLYRVVRKSGLAE
jgi:hypothetical protein